MAAQGGEAVGQKHLAAEAGGLDRGGNSGNARSDDTEAGAVLAGSWGAAAANKAGFRAKGLI